MTDPRRSPDDVDHARRDPGRSAASGTKGWIVAVGILVAIALLGLIVFLHLSGVIGPGAH